jgi:hypothetical protein
VQWLRLAFWDRAANGEYIQPASACINRDRGEPSAGPATSALLRRYRNGEPLKPTRRAIRRHRRLLFDHLVSPREEGFRDRQPKRFCRLKIDDEIELGRLLHRDVFRLDAVEDLVNQTRQLTKDQ